MKASLFYLPSIGSRAEIEAGMAGTGPELYQRMLRELTEQTKLADELGYDSVSFTVLMASMDVTPEAESLFNEVYDTEHVPNLLQVPGVRSVTRMKGEPARFAIAGAVRELPAPSPIYTAIYEIDDPQVLESLQWAEVVERGRWPSQVRPHVESAASAIQGPVTRGACGVENGLSAALDPGPVT